MKQKRILSVVLCCAMLLSATACKQTPPPTEPTEPTEPHEHVLGDWELGKATGCGEEGREDRRCACGYTESRPIAKTAHEFGDYNICKGCGFVNFDPNADFVELGILTTSIYGTKKTANYAWDVKLWDGKIYRGAGDYDKNSGAPPIYAFNIATQSWEMTGYSCDQAIHRFVEIGGKLYAPGIDPTGGWTYGDYYVLESNGWHQIQNLPNGIHNFDMIEFNGMIFAGLGTETPSKTVAYSKDGGKSYGFVPLYKNGAPMDLSGYEWTRTYEFTQYNGQLYALISAWGSIGSRYMLFRYDDGKMVFLRDAGSLMGGSGVSRNYWNGKFELNGVGYLAAGGLYAITDFSREYGAKKIQMPQKETVVDALLKDGVIYTLCYTNVIDPSTYKRIGYTITVYQSTTGQAGSFTKVLSHDYCSMPISFEYDGNHFYIGTGAAVSGSTAKTGMVLRAKPGCEGQ